MIYYKEKPPINLDKVCSISNFNPEELCFHHETSFTIWKFKDQIERDKMLYKILKIYGTDLYD